MSCMHRSPGLRAVKVNEIDGGKQGKSEKTNRAANQQTSKRGSNIEVFCIFET